MRIARQPQSYAGISMAELRSKAIPIEWPDAIAVTQALSVLLLGPAGRAEGIRVDTHTVFIDADGSVKVTPAAHIGVRLKADTTGGVSLVEQVRELLHAMLPDASVPAPLRSVLFDSLPLESLASWSKRIEYYERRNRSLHIQALYERAVGAAVRFSAASAMPRLSAPGAIAGVTAGTAAPGTAAVS